MKILETDAAVGADGSLKLLSPLPDWLKPGWTHLLLVLAEGEGAQAGHRSLNATPEIAQKRKSALQQLRALGGLSDVISDPAAWQRESRRDRSLPGRD